MTSWPATAPTSTPDGAPSDYSELARQWPQAAHALAHAPGAVPPSGPLEPRLVDPTTKVGYTSFSGDAIELLPDKRGVMVPRDPYEAQILDSMGAPRLPGRVSWEARELAATLFRFLVDNPPPTEGLLTHHGAYGTLDKLHQIDAAAQEQRLKGMFEERLKVDVARLLAEIERLGDQDDRVRDVLDRVGITWATINAVAVFLTGAAERLARRAEAMEPTASPDGSAAPGTQ